MSNRPSRGRRRLLTAYRSRGRDLGRGWSVLYFFVVATGRSGKRLTEKVKRNPLPEARPSH